MRGLLRIGLVLAACGSCVQAAKENIDTNSKGVADRYQPAKWNQNSDKIIEHLASVLMGSLGVDENGNRININLKTNEELQSMAHLMGKTLKEQRCNPYEDEYINAAMGGFVSVLSVEEMVECFVTRGKGLLIENILEEVAQTERNRYDIQ